MTALGLKIVLQAPTLIAANPPASNLTDTLLMLPGNTIRGLLAQRYLDLGGDPTTEAFQQLFLTGQVRFGFARVQGAQPLPLSARSCKYDSGFIKDHGHGMLDLLLAGPGEKRCSDETCAQAIDYCHGDWEPTAWRRVPVHTRLITHTAIDPARGTARTAQLYSQRVLGEGQVFVATIDVPEALRPALERLIHKPYTARLGRGSSRGQGWADVCQTTPPALTWDAAAERFQQFQQHEGRAVLAVTLLSDGLLRDAYLRDVTAPTPEDLRPLGIEPDEWQPQPAHAFMDTRMIFGFDGAPLHLPRQPRLAVAAGSVFLFETKKPGIPPTIPSGTGIGWIGEQSGEGYGWAALWHPFHLTPESPPTAEENAQV